MGSVSESELESEEKKSGWDAVSCNGRSSSSAEDGRGECADPVVVVTSYNDFGDLAHQPRGTQAKHALRTYRLNVSDGSLTLLSVELGSEDRNPAFVRTHPLHPDIFYVCTESLSKEGSVLAYSVDGRTGALRKLGEQQANGRSTCYLTMDHAQRFLLAVNYWDSHVVSLPINPETRTLEAAVSTWHPGTEPGTGGGAGGGAAPNAPACKRVNHSENDEGARRERQRDPHTHAVVLDPFAGCVAYVPDLGMDVIHELFFDRATGSLRSLGAPIAVGVRGMAHGPRYIEFHATLPVCFVVNEIASAVAVFSVDRAAIEALAAGQGQETQGLGQGQKRSSSLRPLQVISTIPEAFPGSLNTCGRITVHPSGRFVVVSNRGHDSLAVFRISLKAPAGMLKLVGTFHTRGETPRHFQFDPSGHWLLVANQDSDSLAVFEFNASLGKLTFTNNMISCPAPNFVQCMHL